MSGDRDCGLLVIGSGLAGINAALLAAERGRRVRLIAKSSLERTNTDRAQGGIAAAVAAGDDPERHARDTEAAGAGLCDAAAVRALTQEGPAAIRRLQSLGVGFDRDAAGNVSLAIEGAHSAPRVLHAGGDRTGRAIQSALTARLAEAEVEVSTDLTVVDLALESGRCVGAVAVDGDGQYQSITAEATLLASGGAGALYRNTTNPPTATGDGIGLALRAGAVVRDLEFVQFHPTALAADDGPSFLVSEALRGEGAVLLDGAGDRLMQTAHPDAELAPRSVVARAMAETMRREGSDRVWLDISHRDAVWIRERFPGVTAGCLERGYDLCAGPIPVAPAAHYHMGGVYTDLDGRTTVPGLFACGEAAATGAHGANRVASNSLLEAAVFSSRAIAALEADAQRTADAPPDDLRELRAVGMGAAPSREALQQLMNDRAGMIRHGEDLTKARERLAAWQADGAGEAVDPSLGLMTLAARGIVEAALAREETRGAHVRNDYPQLHPAWRRRLAWRTARD